VCFLNSFSFFCPSRSNSVAQTRILLCICVCLFCVVAAAAILRITRQKIFSRSWDALQKLSLAALLISCFPLDFGDFVQLKVPWPPSLPAQVATVEWSILLTFQSFSFFKLFFTQETIYTFFTFYWFEVWFSPSSTTGRWSMIAIVPGNHQKEGESPY